MPDWFDALLRRFRSIAAYAPVPNLRRSRKLKGARDHLVNLKRLRRRFDPLKAARIDAVGGRTGTQTDARGRYEHDVAVAFQEEMKDLKQAAEKHMRELDIQIKRLPPLPAIEEREILLKVEQEETATFQGWHDRLVNGRLDALLNKRSLNAFRRANGIIRAVEHPKVFVGILGIIAVFFIEATLNFNYLAPTGIAAPSEVLVFVMSTALVNVGLGVGCGYVGVRSLHHIKIYRKLVGGVVILVSLFLALCLHCLLANYRHAIVVVQSDPDVQNNAALLLQEFSDIPTHLRHDIFANPLGFLVDPTAIVVFLYGIIFNGIATIEGATLLSDRYPGLGRHDHAFRRASARSEAVNRSFRAAMTKIIDDVKASLDVALRTGEQRVQVVKTFLDDALTLGRRFEEEATTLENTLVRMIADYRDEYRHVREVKGPPFWEDDDPRLDREIGFEFDHLMQIEEKVTADYRGMADSVETIKTRVTAHQAELLTKIEAYFVSIDQEAVAQDRDSIW